MTAKKVSGGVAHKLPADLRAELLSTKLLLEKWEDLTPLARNEWICWIITVKQQTTRTKHIKRAVQELKEGKRRPCCWIGCIHRTDKAVSPSVKWVLSRQAKS